MSLCDREGTSQAVGTSDLAGPLSRSDGTRARSADLAPRRSALANGIALVNDQCPPPVWSAWSRLHVLRVLADEPVDRLTDEVGMTDVSGVLLDGVDQESPQAPCPTIRRGVLDQLVQAVAG